MKRDDKVPLTDVTRKRVVPTSGSTIHGMSANTSSMKGRRTFLAIGSQGSIKATRPEPGTNGSEHATAHSLAGPIDSPDAHPGFLCRLLCTARRHICLPYTRGELLDEGDASARAPHEFHYQSSGPCPRIRPSQDLSV